MPPKEYDFAWVSAFGEISLCGYDWMNVCFGQIPFQKLNLDFKINSL